MTYQNYNGNQLCDRLCFKFRNRGINKVLNTAAAPSSSAGAKRTAGARAATGAAGSARPDGKYSAAYARGAKIRNYAEHFNADAYERRRRVTVSKPVKVKKSFGEALRSRLSDFFSGEDTGSGTERRIKSAPVPKGFVAAVVLCTVMLMAVLYTYSSYSEITSEVKSLQNTQAQLLQERDKASNLLSIRDDIREIESYATEEIGMVKSDYVETRHVSIAGGERIEVMTNQEEEAPEGIFSTLLSAMGSYRERLLEYID